MIGGLIALLLLVAVGLLYYWIDWSAARAERRDQSSADYLKAYQAFLENIDTDRLEAAYQWTTATFRRRVSQEAFNERARRYRAFKKRPDTQGIESGSSGPVGGDYRGPNQMVFTSTLEDGAGKQLQYSITVVQVDSIFYRRPPPPQVGEFTVQEVTAKAPWQP
jgi:hypothetical protein